MAKKSDKARADQSINAGSPSEEIPSSETETPPLDGVSSAPVVYEPGDGHEQVGKGAEGPDGAHTRFRIVGIGASAGGIEALQALFDAMPPDTGMAFVIVQHLAPQRESIIAELIGRHTPMHCRQVADPTPVEPNHVYVIPPDKTMTIKDGVLMVHQPAEPLGHRSPIDHFFVSLADDQGDRAVAVVLSGAGNDGTLGIKAVKEHGGLTMAQAGGRHESMPRHAIATGVVDMVVPVEDMPRALLDHMTYQRKLARQRRPSIVDDIARSLPELTALLRRKTGHDFGQYKPNTIIRRTQRRMQLLHIESFDSYLVKLRDEPAEAEMLFNDLLIGVTYFFRDKEAFATLSRIVIPEVFGSKSADDTVRVWVPGCSTGEESYSIAILLREYMARLDTVPRMQIFASDIDNDALNIGRAAVYATSIVEQVTPERLERFFMKSDGGYKLNKDVRDMCLFSVHNLIKDPPFSRLNVLSCRNVLIYLDSDLQRRLMHLFHYALHPGGFLFLGPSESVSGHTDLFEPIEKSMGIYRRKEAIIHAPVEFPVTDSRFMLHRLAEHGIAPKLGTADVPRNVERLLLNAYAPACVVVNSLNEVVYFAGHTGRYLEPPPGHPTHDVLEMARRGLRMELRNTLYEARKLQKRVVRPSVKVQTNGHVQEIDLIIQPLSVSETEPSLYLIVFQDTSSVHTITRRPVESSGEGGQPDSLKNLEEELNATKQHLQSTVEELEASNEELKSMNEELLSMNEELQSTNEELETSREELQSVNEELETVNTELASKVQALGRANDDLKNLLESTQIATIFLDNSFRIKGFTPAITEIFNLIETDNGRPITDIASRFALGDLLTDARHVLRTLTARERQVKIADTNDDGWHLMRILPYRTQDNVIDGVVVSFVDIREVKRAEEAVKRSEERFRTISDSDMIGIAFFDRGGRITQANHVFLSLTGYGASEVESGRLRWDRLSPPETQDGLRQLIQELQTNDAVRDREHEFVRRDGTRFWGMFGCALIGGSAGNESVGFLLDITSRKLAQQHQQMLVDELDHRVKNTLAIVDALCSQTARESSSLEVFEEALHGRIQALAHAHRELSRAQWRGAELLVLIRQTLAPHFSKAAPRVAIDGPLVVLTPKATLALALVFHELATNAVKYGALANSNGHDRLTVNWMVNPTGNDPRLVIRWVESVSHAIEAPAKPGFGTRLIERTIQHDCGGKVDARFDAQGLNCIIDLPWQPGIGRTNSLSSET